MGPPHEPAQKVECHLRRVGGETPHPHRAAHVAHGVLRQQEHFNRGDEGGAPFHLFSQARGSGRSERGRKAAVGAVRAGPMSEVRSATRQHASGNTGNTDASYDWGAPQDFSRLLVTTGYVYALTKPPNTRRHTLTERKLQPDERCHGL